MWEKVKSVPGRIRVAEVAPNSDQLSYRWSSSFSVRVVSLCAVHVLSVGRGERLYDSRQAGRSRWTC